MDGSANVELSVYDNELQFFYNDGNAVSKIATNGQYVQFSDKRLKRGITPYRTAILDNVYTLPLYTYRYNSEPGDAPLSFGVIAQDVEERFPELISRTVARDGNTYLGVAYDKFGLLAIKAIQEQGRIIEQQQADIARLIDEVDALKQQVGTLEALVRSMLEAKK